jgi:hypothetical protein
MQGIRLNQCKAELQLNNPAKAATAAAAGFESMIGNLACIHNTQYVKGSHKHTYLHG